MNVWAVYLSNQLYSLYETEEDPILRAETEEYLSNHLHSLYETEEQAKEKLADLKKIYPRRNSYYLRHVVNKKSA